MLFRSAAYLERVEALICAMLVDAGVRLPGYRRWDLAERSRQQGIEVLESVLAPIQALAYSAPLV